MTRRHLLGDLSEVQRAPVTENTLTIHHVKKVSGTYTKISYIYMHIYVYIRCKLVLVYSTRYRDWL